MAKIVKRYNNSASSILPWAAAGGLAYILLKPKKESILVGVGQLLPGSEVHTELPDTETVTSTIQIGGEVRTLTGRELTPEEYPDAKKIIDAYFAAGKCLTKWRNSVMAIRDWAYVRWPEFARYELPKYAPTMPQAELDKIYKQGEWITALYEEMADQYGMAQQEYDALMAEVDAIKQELADAGFAGLGNPAIGVLIIIVIAIVAVAVSTVAVTQYLGELEVSTALKEMTDTAKLETESLEKSREQFNEHAKTIGNLAEKLPQEKREQFLTNSLQQAYANEEKRMTSIAAAGQRIPQIYAAAEKAAKATAKAVRPQGKFDWIEYLPYVGLALMGIIIAPSLRDMISGYTKKS